MSANPPLPLTYVARPAAKSDGKPPLLILLHGVGSHENDLFGLAPALDERFVIVSARAPNRLPSGGFAWYPINYTPGAIRVDPVAAAESQAILNRFIPEAAAAFDADPQRIYLMGFSQGAIMSLNTMLSNPEAITGVVAMSGRLIVELRSSWVEPERLKGFPVMVVHGTYDNVLSIEDGRAARDTLAALPVDLTYREYPMAHQVSDASLRDIQTWLRDQLATDSGD